MNAKISANESYFYKILLAYEVPFNVLDAGGNLEKMQVRDKLYDILGNLVPEEKYERYSMKLVLYQLRDTYNYVIMYEAFFRATEGLPMGEYVSAQSLKERASRELEEFFVSQDCECKKISIKTLL